MTPNSPPPKPTTDDRRTGRLTGIDRRAFLRVSGAAALTAGLTGCSGNTDESDGGGKAPTTQGRDGTTQPPQRQVFDTKIAAAHYPTILDSVTTVVAEKKGFFEEHNINNGEVVSFSGGGTTVRGVVTGGLVAGKGALAACVKAYLAGAPVHLVGMMMAGSTIDFETLPNSSIQKIQDLKGGKLAVSNPGSSSEAVAIRSLQTAEGIALDDVEIVYAGGLGEAITTLKEELVDVAFNVVPKSTVMLENGEMRRVWHARDHAPNITQHVMFVGARVLNEKPELASGMIRAHGDAMAYIRENPEESATLWAAEAGIPSDIAIEGMRDAHPDEMFRIELDEQIVTTTGATLITQGIVEEAPPWGDIIHQEPLYPEHRVDWVE